MTDRGGFDSVVVGAGPAGSVAARELALAGLKVLLVDKAAFPRSKVCGCCINAVAQATLADIGLGDLTRRGGALPIRSVRLAAAGRSAILPIRGGQSLSRAALDKALVEAAVADGVTFWPRTPTALDGGDEQGRWLLMRRDKKSIRLKTSVVVAADGVGGSLLRGIPEMKCRTASGAWIGLATVCERAPNAWEPTRISMACGRRGYVGMVQLEDRRLNVAAAVDPRWVRRVGGPGQAAVAILSESGLDPPQSLRQQGWCGTATLTRRRQVLGAHRLLVIGDAAGYVEPFTGEGIAWALTSGRGVAPWVAAGIRRWPDELARQWTSAHRDLIGRRQRLCRAVRQGLRSPTLTRLAVASLSMMPALAKPVVRLIDAPLVNLIGSQGER